MNISSRASEKAIVGITLVLLVIGVLAVYSASSFQCIRQWGRSGSFLYLIGHLKRVVVGILLAVGAYMLPQRIWRAAALPMFLGSICLVALTVIPGNPLAAPVNGASRWLELGPIRLMPSELTRFSLVILIATLVSQGRISIRTSGGFSVAILAGLVPASLMIFQPDFAGAGYLIVVLLITLFLSEARFSHLFFMALLLLGLAAAVVFSSRYRMDRITGYRNQQESVMEENFQPLQACIALGSGGLRGRGLGQGRQQRGFLPEASSDFILAVIGEETGFIGTSLVLLLLVSLCALGWTAALNADNAFGQIAAGGLSASLACGVIIHAGVVTRTLPATGMPLPLVSWGGTNMVVTLVSLGLILRITAGGRR